MSEQGKGTVPAAGAEAPVDADNAVSSLARSLQLFLNLGVAQLDAAVRESDSEVGRISQGLAAIATELLRYESRRPAGAPPDEHLEEMIRSVRASAQGVIKAMQFYDKLVQRLSHVRSGLAIPADATAEMAAALRVDWNDILDQVRSRYSMVEERVLFDFMMRGLRAEQMLKALASLREASSPGELELF